ncbi:MAG TPA: ABC transporter permease subunit [Asanoa sp.]
MSDVGVIHDIGYQRYDGPRLGRRYVFGSLFAHGFRTAFGLGRGAKSKIFPWFVTGVVIVVAVVLMAIRAQTGTVVLTYLQFPQTLGLLIVLFCAVAAPELVSRDLQSGVLPLYFSRPLRPSDYGLAKLAALVAAITAIFAAGEVIMFLGAAFTVKGFGNIFDEFQDMLGGVAYSAVHALVFGSIAILVASLMKRRAVAAGALVAIFVLTTPVFGVLAVLPSTTANQLSGLVSPGTLVGGVGDWVFQEQSGAVDIGPYGPLYLAVAVALVVGCTGLLLARYRKVAKA